MTDSRRSADLGLLSAVVAVSVATLVCGFAWWYEPDPAAPAWPSVCQVIQPEDMGR